MNITKIMSICSVCGEKFENDIRFLNHMMENMDLGIQILTNLTEIVVDIKIPINL